MAQPRYAAVAVPVPVRRLFSYSIDEALAPRITTGVRVRVPFGRRTLVATIVEFPAARPAADVEPKPVLEIVDDAMLDPRLLELTRFVADYYLCSWGEAIETALPPGCGTAGPRVVRLGDGASLEAIPRRATARRRLFRRVAERDGPLSLASLGTNERRLLPTMVEDGLLVVVRGQTGSDREPPEPRHAPPAEAPTPTAAQARVLERIDPAIERRGFRPFVLFGATGSGKTEVYFRAAERALAGGRGVLYLVPEIGLTPLLLGAVRRRFRGEVTVLHSGLGRRERRDGWNLVRTGRSRFVIGTRSAVFAPLADIGLIVVDEEQDGSYKQSETPRYNGRDLAVVRAHAHEATIVLGSATPSMETFRHARAERYELLRLGDRIERRPLADVRIVDMREVYRARGEVTPLSPLLAGELRDCLERGDQALILRNRRGWAAALHCPSCGDRVECPNCTIALTWHRAARRLRCHYCGLEQGYPDACPRCGAAELNPLGEGTERIEDRIKRLLPAARIDRMDRDTIRRRGAHEKMLRRFERGEIDVLVGTQMIAKGHDFPRVTLVGVLSADQALGIPDFRAAERAFQLLTQVAGRAGRGASPGRVVVQAFDADHPVLGLAARQDYEAFYDREIRYRRALRYPPLSALVQIIVQDKDPITARGWSERLAEALREQDPERLLLSGPGPAPIERLRGRVREQILVRGAGRRRLVETVDRALRAVEGQIPRRAITVDVDPLSLL
ncbi:MAG TPA: primosomal protein N' [Candidatus Polarisedimenticolaceae bacterium]|nr:primosomal protein N' [Candidatus Polarisedimenticolaceae bacterium]